jgi:C-terminal processing protease CtpA/Prc
MKKLLPIWCLCVLTRAAAVAADPPPADLALFRQTWDLLREAGHEVDPAAADRAAAAALIGAIDSGGELLGEDREAASAPSGVIPVFLRDEGERVVIDRTLFADAANTPLRTGDVLLQVGDEPAALHPVPDLNALLRGVPVASPVRFTVERDETLVITAAVEAVELDLPPVDSIVSCGENGLCLRLNRVDSEAAAALSAALEEEISGDVVGLVLDLRGVGGSSADAAADVADVFVPAGRFLFRMNPLAGGPGAAWAAEEPDRSGGRPLILLTDGNTRGGAELLAAVLRAARGGTLVFGAETRGDPLIRETMPLSGDLSIRAAVRAVELPGDRGWPAGAGWEPDINGRSFDDEPSRDPVLRRAADLLIGLRALQKTP